MRDTDCSGLGVRGGDKAEKRIVAAMIQRRAEFMALAAYEVTRPAVVRH